MHRFDWTDDDEGASTDFQISGSKIFKLLRETGFEVVDFRELFAPDDAGRGPSLLQVGARRVGEALAGRGDLAGAKALGPLAAKKDRAVSASDHERDPHQQHMGRRG